MKYCLTRLLYCFSFAAMGRKTVKKDPALQHAIQAAGGPAELARTLGITIQAVCGWRRCPTRRAIDVENATGGVVSRQRLRPDLYPSEA
jgi:DNA-binding transcriptional regulator YdaS (Cro superfamily)